MHYHLQLFQQCCILSVFSLITAGKSEKSANSLLICFIQESTLSLKVSSSGSIVPLKIVTMSKPMISSIPENLRFSIMSQIGEFLKFSKISKKRLFPYKGLKRLFLCLPSNKQLWTSKTSLLAFNFCSPLFWYTSIPFFNFDILVYLFVYPIFIYLSVLIYCLSHISWNIYPKTESF